LLVSDTIKFDFFILKPLFCSFIPWDSSFARSPGEFWISWSGPWLQLLKLHSPEGLSNFTSSLCRNFYDADLLFISTSVWKSFRW